MILLAVASVALCTYSGVRFAGNGRGRSFDRGLGLLVLCLWCAYNVYYFMPTTFDIAVSLPLHLCDITAPVCALAVMTRGRRLRALMYFWAFTFAVQAFIFPVGDQNPANMRFWLFWGLHISIVACAVYDMVGRGFRPGVRDLWTSVAVGTGYVAVILPMNVFFGWNYGYIGPGIPNIPTPVDLLGPWPLRVLWMYLLMTAMQAALLVPWVVRGARGR